MPLGIVLKWFHSDGKYPLRMLLLRTAGSGKTQTIRAIVTTLRSGIEQSDLKCRVAICAYTGVAAALMGMGGKTIRSLFKINPRSKWRKYLINCPLRDLERQLGHCALIIVDEVSYFGQVMFAKMNQREEQARSDFLNAHPRITSSTFGHIGVLVGDFAQLPPVQDRMLILGRPERNGVNRLVLVLARHSDIIFLIRAKLLCNYVGVAGRRMISHGWNYVCVLEMV